MRDAVRALRAAPGMTAAIVLSLGVGIGATTAIFALLNAMLLRPLAVPAPHRLVVVVSQDQRQRAWPQPVWQELRDRRIIPGGFAWFWNRFDTAKRGERQFVDGMAASGGMFGALGLEPAIGRLLTREDDELEAGPDGLVAVISHRFWQRQFRGSSGVLGQPLSVDGRQFTIVGVMPSGFAGLLVGLPLDVVIPLGRPSPGPGSPYVTIMGRLAPGQTPEQVGAALRVVQPVIRDSTNPYSVNPYREEYLREPFAARPAPRGISFLERRYSRPLAILLGAVSLVLLMACGNIAMLLLARTTGRRHELAVRAALGAPRSRLAGQLGLESLLLAMAGAALGLLFAQWCMRLVLAGLSTQAYSVFLDVAPDWRVLAFTSGVGLLTATLCGAAPAFRAFRTDGLDMLRVLGEGRGRRFGAGSAVVVAQIGLSLTIIVATGLFARTYRALATTALGFEADRVVAVAVDATESAWAPGARGLLYERVIEALVSAPGVEGAGISIAVPGGNMVLTPWIQLADGTPLPQGGNGVHGNHVTAGWFRAMGTRVVAGREFLASDRIGAPAVAVVNQTFADRFLKSRSPLGQTILQRASPDGPPQPLEIVGVAADAVSRSIREPAPPAVYTPLLQIPDPVPAAVNVVVRMAPTASAGMIRLIPGTVARVDADLSLTLRTLSDQVSAQYAQERLVARAAGILGGLAVLLAALGLYGTAAYAVSRRRREIAIRMALGAAPRNVMRLVLTRVIALVSAGLALGLLGGLWVGQFVKAMLYGVGPGDAATLTGACVLLAAVAMFSGWLPARRAVRLDPASILKEA